MPWSNDYKKFIRSGEWKRIRLEQLKREPLCRFCREMGKTTAATEVDHSPACDPLT